jgi:CBS domain-containing protein
LHYLNEWKLVEIKGRAKVIFMQVKDMMTSKVECISPEDPIRDAAQLMKSLDVGFLPVLDDGRLVGTLTDRDIVLRVIAEGKDVQYCKARDVMTSDVFWCYEDQNVDEVADCMAEKETRRMLILDHAKRLVGVVSIGDLAKVGGEQQKTGETIKEIAEAPPASAA